VRFGRLVDEALVAVARHEHALDHGLADRPRRQLADPGDVEHEGAVSRGCPRECSGSVPQPRRIELGVPPEPHLDHGRPLDARQHERLSTGCPEPGRLERRPVEVLAVRDGTVREDRHPDDRGVTRNRRGRLNRDRSGGMP